MEEGIAFPSQLGSSSLSCKKRNNFMKDEVHDQQNGRERVGTVVRRFTPTPQCRLLPPALL